MKLYRLNVSRTDAGRAIPFDRVYLAPEESKKALKQLFDYALILPFTDEFRGYLEQVRPCLVEEYPSAARKKEGTPDPATDWWAGMLDEVSRGIMVVPILPKRARALFPSYLVNARWYRLKATKKARLKKNLLPSLAYLQTPEQNFRPVCVACPRFSEHQAGMCHLGERICFDTLVLGDVLSRPEDSVVDVREGYDE